MEEELKTVDVEEAMDQTILEQIENLKKYEPGTPEYIATTETLSKFYKLRVEEQKNKVDERIRDDQLNEEYRLKVIQFKHAKRDRILAGVANVACVAFDKFCDLRVFDRALKFEETGTFTSIISRNLLGKFFRKKR